MDGTDQETIGGPDQNHPDYYRYRRQLKAWPQDESGSGPVVVGASPTDEAEEEVQRSKRLAQAFGIGQGPSLLQSFMQLLQNSRTPSETDPDRSHYRKSGNAPVFTAPNGQTVSFALQIPGDANGDFVKEDSYLFITEDGFFKGGKGLRAFIVPKSDPSKQFELSVSNAVLDTTVNHQFRATLGKGHSLVVGTDSTSLDGHGAGLINNNCMIDDLVRQATWMSCGGSVNFEDQTTFSGDSIVISRKDFKTGIIKRFTQDGATNHGRLDTIQGNPVSQEQMRNDEACNWLRNGEMDRVPISSKVGPLPQDMKEGLISQAAQIPKQGYIFRWEEALRGLIPEAGTLQAQIVSKNQETAVQLNAEERKQGQIPQTAWPRP